MTATHYTQKFLREMGAKSHELQAILRAAGFVKKDGASVSTAGIHLVDRLARENNLRQWPHTQTVADYDALIRVTRDYLASRPIPADLLP